MIQLLLLEFLSAVHEELADYSPIHPLLIPAYLSELVLFLRRLINNSWIFLPTNDFISELKIVCEMAMISSKLRLTYNGKV
jgi:hypothetical protein